VVLSNQPGQLPPLKPLHPETSLSPAKLATFEKLSLRQSGNRSHRARHNCLKTRPDAELFVGGILIIKAVERLG
jgi:hypothetical protein